MTYRYKRTAAGILMERKARCALRSDKMIANLHFNPRHTASSTADKSIVRLIFAIVAAQCMPIDHFDIKSGFIRERYRHNRPVYAKQHPRFDGSYMHPHTKAGMLIKNLYSSPSGGHYYLKGAEEWIILIGFAQCQDNPCLFKLTTKSNRQILIALTLHDFLLAASDVPLADWLYAALNCKYKNKVTRIGSLKQYLGCKI